MDNITYIGKVNISTSDGEVISTFTNKGTKDLGLVITKALAGYDVKDDIPKYFSIEYLDNGKGVWYSALNRKLPLTGITYDATDQSENNLFAKLNLNCIICDTDKKLNPQNNPLRLCLYSNSGKLLAVVMDTALKNTTSVETNISLIEIFTGISQGTDCLINWQMSFYNDQPNDNQTK